jgi:hypothetical protein
MSWQGSGAFVAWHDVETGREAEYVHWHSHEHMQERVAIPGFLHGRRYAVIGPGPDFLIVYAVTDMGVFTSPAYLERLDNPSVWTREVMPALRNMNRSLCRVEASSGSGMGRFMQTVRFSPEGGREPSVRAAIATELASLGAEAGLCAAHLLVADRRSSTRPTQETGLRAVPDTVADWVLLVEGYDKAAVARDRSVLLSRAGAAPNIAADLYGIEHVVLREPDSGPAGRPRPSVTGEP